MLELLELKDLYHKVEVTPLLRQMHKPVCCVRHMAVTSGDCFTVHVGTHVLCT